MKNENGMSLIEVMVTASIMVGVGLMMSKLTVNNNKAMKVTERNFEISSILNEIRANLSDPLACKSSFPISINASNQSNISEIKSAIGTPLFKTNTSYGSSGVKISSMALNDSHGEVTVIPNGGSGTTNFVIEFDRGAKTGATRFVKKNIRLSVITNSGSPTDKTIQSCNAFSGGVSTIWSRKGSDKIYFNEGRIGIGTDEPGSMLQISNNDPTIILKDTDSQYNSTGIDTAILFTDRNNRQIGDIGFTSSTNSNFSISNITTNGDIIFKAGMNHHGVALERMRIEDNGYVGIGVTQPDAKLHVTGAIKFGTSNLCNAATEGSQRYNSGLKQMEFCNGTSWNTMGDNSEWTHALVSAPPSGVFNTSYNGKPAFVNRSDKNGYHKMVCHLKTIHLFQTNVNDVIYGHYCGLYNGKLRAEVSHKENSMIYLLCTFDCKDKK